MGVPNPRDTAYNLKIQCITYHLTVYRKNWLLSACALGVGGAGARDYAGHMRLTKSGTARTKLCA